MQSGVQSDGWIHLSTTPQTQDPVLLLFNYNNHSTMFQLATDRPPAAHAGAGCVVIRVCVFKRVKVCLCIGACLFSVM